MTCWRYPAWLIALPLFLACAPAAREAGAPGAVGAGPRPDTAPKTIVVSALGSFKVFGHSEFPGGGAASLTDIHSNGLVTNDTRGGLEPRLAARFPSLEDGTIVLLPDGRMQTTWKLRPNIKWHDGTPFSAEDLALGLAIRLDIPGPEANVASRQIESFDVPDPLTAVITWRTTFYRHLDLHLSELWPYPRHILGVVDRSDRELFLNLPYWTTGYVHVGPFRLVDYGMGDTQIYERFDDYFLGRPKVDRIILRPFSDSNTLFANLQAGAVDLAAEESLPTDLAVQLRDEWQQNAEGAVFTRIENLRFVMVQLNPEWARAPDLSRDPRARRGLYYGLDRDAIRDLSLPGLPDTEAESFLRKNDPRGPTVGLPLARYRYDAVRATRELADIGWQRAVDGRLLNQAGEQVQIDLRGSAGSTKETNFVAQLWRQTLGMDVAEETVPTARQQDREYRAKFPGLEFRSSNGDNVFSLFDSRARPTAENRWVGGNPTSYVNPAYDRLLESFFSAFEQPQQAAVIKEMSEILASDLPILPMYVRVDLAPVRKGVRALADDYAGTTLTRGMARNAYLWDRD